MISSQRFFKNSLRFWSCCCSKFCWFLGGLVFFLFSHTAGKFFSVQQLSHNHFLVILQIYTSLCWVTTRKIVVKMLLHEREATGNPDFLLFGGFLIPNLSIKQQDLKNLFEYHNKGPSRLSIKAKEQ